MCAVSSGRNRGGSRLSPGSSSETGFNESYSSPSMSPLWRHFPHGDLSAVRLQKCVSMDVLGIALPPRDANRAYQNGLTLGGQQRLEGGSVAALHLASREAILDTAYALHCLPLPSSEASVIAALAFESRPTGSKKLIPEIALVLPTGATGSFPL